MRKFSKATAAPATVNGHIFSSFLLKERHWHKKLGRLEDKKIAISQETCLKNSIIIQGGEDLKTADGYYLTV